MPVRPTTTRGMGREQGVGVVRLQRDGLVVHVGGIANGHIASSQVHWLEDARPARLAGVGQSQPLDEVADRALEGGEGQRTDQVNEGGRQVACPAGLT